MRIQSRIWVSIAASLIVSVVIASFAFSVVRGIGDDLARGRHYSEVINKTFALNLLVATFDQESGPRALQQLGEVRASLTMLLDNLSSSDVREESLIRQIQRNNQELGPLLNQFFAPEQNGALRAELKDMLAAQLYTKARFISDDTSRLMEISESRIVSAHAKAGITVLLFLITLIAANVLISFVSGRSIVRMQVDLQKQREWLQVTLSSIGDAVIATDTKSKISFINPVASALTGWPIEEALGRPVQDLFRIINEKTREPAEDIVGRVLRERGNVALANHTALVARDGRKIPIEDSAAPIKDSAGKVAGVVLVFHDVTGKRRAEEALRRSAQFPEENPHPVLRIAAGGPLLYANAPARDWLATFGGQADGSLPPPVGAVVAHAGGQDHAISTEISNPAGSTFWITAVQPHGEDYINLYCIDITQRKQAEDALKESEHRVRAKLDAILSPEGEIGALDLADMIDAAGIQALMEDFYKLAKIPMSIADLQGKMLVGVGWQTICTKFHRAHPETCGHCIESDTQLSAGLAPGEVRLYKCRNHMWDIATPIFIGGKHVGNVYSGQFLFEGESLDYELFREQARRYGFDEAHYIAALEAVPRLTRETVDTGMAFFTKLTQMLSQVELQQHPAGAVVERTGPFGRIPPTERAAAPAGAGDCEPGKLGTGPGEE